MIAINDKSKTVCKCDGDSTDMAGKGNKPEWQSSQG